MQGSGPNRSRRSFLRNSLQAALAVPLAAGCGNTGSLPTFQALPAPDPANPRVRRSVASLSPEERRWFVDGVLALKTVQSPMDPALSYYDHLVTFHRETVRYARTVLGYSVSNDTPAFLPWHRKFNLLLEDAIRSVAFPSFNLPYWDWTDTASLAILFSDDFLGPSVGDPNDNYAVHRGPFRKGAYVTNITPMPIGDNDPTLQAPFTFLTRGPKSVDLPTQAQVTAALQVERYSSPPYNNLDRSQSFNTTLRGAATNGQSPILHAAGHGWVGGSWDGIYYDLNFNQKTITYLGTMTMLDVSPNDPIFFLHHCNIDRIWAEWERTHGNVYEPESGYPLGYNIDDPQYPFSLYAGNPVMDRSGITPRSMLDTLALGYTFDTLL